MTTRTPGLGLLRALASASRTVVPQAFQPVHRGPTAARTRARKPVPPAGPEGSAAQAPRWKAPALAAVLLALAATANATGRGSPWPLHVIDDTSRGADGVRLADANRDGLPDIVTGWEEGGVVRLYLNPGPRKARQPWPAVTVGRVRSVEDAVLADLDSDGAMDVVSCCEGRTRSVFVHWAPKKPEDILDPTAWHTEPFPTLRGKAMWMFALPLQIDGRDGIDLVVGAKGRDAKIGWLQAPPDPRKLPDWTWHPLYDAGWIMSLIALDVDGDGDLDILASDRKGKRRGCLWLENPGPGLRQRDPWPEHRIGVGDREVMFITTCDLDRDGLTDILAATRGHELLYYRRTTAKPPKWETHVITLPPDTGTGKAVAVADINLDGRPDIVFTCEHARGKSGVVWLSYRRSPFERQWQAHEISGPRGTKYDLVVPIDLDADGDPDILTCEEAENLGVIWHENPTR